MIFDLIVTIGLWYFVSNNAKTEALGRFQFRSHEIGVAIKERLSAYEQVLKGGVGLFESTHLKVDRDMFRTYVENLNIDEQYRGIQGIGFSTPISPQDKENHIREVRESGFPDYTIKPEGIREQYTSIIYLEPFSDRNLRAFGYDMFSEPVRRKAMEEARDTGIPTLSGKITLVQETDQDIQTGFLMYLPVYKIGVPLKTIEERRAALFGYVYSPFRSGDFLEGVLGQRKIPDIAFKLFDGDDPEKKSLLSSSDPDHNNAKSLFQENLKIEFYDHVWVVELSSLKAFESTIQKGNSILVLVIGVFVSLVFFTVLWLTHIARSKAIQYGQKLNENLLESEERLNMALDGNNDGIWDWDVLTGEVYFSPRWMTMLGFEPDELPGNVSTWEKLVHPDDMSEVIKVLNEHLEGKTSFYMTEHRVKTKSGKYIWILDRGKVFSRTPEGKPLRATGTHTDITERKLIEQELEAHKNHLEELVQERTREMAKTIESLKDSESLILEIQKDLLARESELSQAQEIAHLGSWTWNVQGNKLSWSDEIYQIFGLEKNELKPTYENFLNTVKKEDRTLVHRANRDSILGKTGYDIKYRIVLPNGDMKHVHQKSKTHYDPEGYPLKVVGIIHDIDKMKIAEENLLKNRKKFRQLYSQISKVLEGTSSATTGENFFHSLVYHLASTLGFESCFIGRLDTKNKATCNTLAFIKNGENIPNFKYELRDTPCELSYHGAAIYYLNHLQKAFPKDECIKNFRLESYLGVPIFGKDNYPVAHLAVMDSQPKEYSPDVMSILSLFSARAGAEMTRININKKLEVSQKKLRKLNKKIQTVREEEKLHLAREMHDELGQVITYCKLDILWIQKEIKNPGDKITKKFESTVLHLDDTLNKVRRIASELRPETLDVLGIAEAMKWQAQKFTDQTHIECEVDITPEKIQCNRNQSIDLFRIFQETLTNISRHAQASRVQIKFAQKEKFFMLIVKDNGKGFDTSLIAQFNSLGILGMKERSLSWGGQVDIQSTYGIGTTVSVSLPIKG